MPLLAKVVFSLLVNLPSSTLSVKTSAPALKLVASVSSFFISVASFLYAAAFFSIAAVSCSWTVASFCYWAIYSPSALPASLYALIKLSYSAICCLYTSSSHSSAVKPWVIYLLYNSSLVSFKVANSSTVSLLCLPTKPLYTLNFWVELEIAFSVVFQALVALSWVKDSTLALVSAKAISASTPPAIALLYSSYWAVKVLILPDNSSRLLIAVWTLSSARAPYTAA